MKFSVEYKNLEKNIPRLFKGKKKIINAKRNPRSMKIGATDGNQACFEFLQEAFSVEAMVEKEGIILLSPKLFEKIFPVLKKERINFEAKDGKLQIKQGTFELAVPYISKEGGMRHKVLTLQEDKIALQKEIEQTKKQIVRLREEAHLENENISQNADYKERFLGDKYIYYRRLVKEKEKRLQSLIDKLKT